MNRSDELGQLLCRMSPAIDDTGVWHSIEQRANQSRRNRVWFLVRIATAVILVAGASIGILRVVNHLDTPRPIVVIGDDTTLPTAASTTTLTAEQAAQHWYDSGAYMGYWAGNVETIPERSADLPDLFFTGPTPSRPVQTDDQGTATQMDPSEIKKPLWVFGDEVQVGDYSDEIRQAKADGRPVLFYATSAPDATSALGLEPMAYAGTSLERLIVSWLPWLDSGKGNVSIFSFDPLVDPKREFVFVELVNATLTKPYIGTGMTTVTAVDRPPMDGPPSVRATEVMTKEEIAAQIHQLDGRIPAGEHLGPIVFDAIADSAGMTSTDPGDYTPFPWLAQEDQATYMQLRAAGESFTLVQGDDRYFHLVR